MDRCQRFRNLLKEKDFLVTPGVGNPLHAMIVEQVGFNWVYMSGYSSNLSILVTPDVGLMTETEMVTNARNIARCVKIPVIADADTGFGNAVNVMRTVEDYGSHEILSLFSDIIEELRNRGLTRSKNNPVADYAEHLVFKAFSLTPAEKSTKGYYAVDINDKKYEIKSRRYSAGIKPTRFSAIRDLETQHFDILVAVLFFQDFTVQRAVFLPYATVRRTAFRQEHVNGWILPIRDSLWSADGVVDVTEVLRETQKEEERPTRESSVQ